MKKLILVVITILLVQFAAASAQDISVELITEDNYYPLIFDENSNPPETAEINGVIYLWDSLKDGRHPIKYDIENYDLFKTGYDYICTGEYYISRYAGGDGTSGMSKMKNTKLYIYDLQMNLVGSQQFDGYISKIGYCGGVCYCKESSGRYWRSEDLINWTEAVSGTIFADNFGDIFVRLIKSEDGQTKYQVSVDENKFYTVEYETENLLSNTRYFGKWIFSKIPQSVYLSLDGIYLTNINVNYDYTYIQPSGNDSVIMYEYQKELIIEWIPAVLSFGQAFSDIKGYRFRMEKQPVYEALEQLEASPYIVYNDILLAFEQPPIIENDRTLIPIRFLFEQMGATVDWNGDTQTATITQDNTAVSFAINDTEADVNGQTVSMEVPAQLINGKTMVPVRFLSEELGYDVEWDGENRIITIE